MNLQAPTIGSSVRLRRAVTDLGRVDSSLSAILSPGNAPETIDRHSDVLLQHDYEENLRPFPLTRGSIDHWIELLRTSMPASHQRFDESFKILDLESGIGTAVFPLLELYPNAEIIASDLSVSLLRDLRHWHSDHYPTNRRLSLLQLNAEDTVFDDAQLDIVTGAHVLHRFPDLRKVFDEVHRILKPGGVALFFEGFESGSQLLSLVMQLLIARNESTPAAQQMSSDVVAGFRVFMDDLWRRKGVAKSRALLDAIDHKWVFTETQLRTAIASSGLQLAGIRQIASSEGLVSRMVDHELKRRLHTLAGLPEWARKLVFDVERQISPELLSETLFSGAIQLSKPAGPAPEARAARPPLLRTIMSPEARRAAMAKAAPISERILEYERSLPEHRSGTVEISVLQAMERLAPSPLDWTMETGCGKTTILLSNLSASHHVFSFDDSNEDGSSITYFRRCPVHRADRAHLIPGPTQQTLPRFVFDRPIDLALLDGPHGYPFPELEYFYVYPHLRTGALLVIDDIHIPTIHRLYRFLAEDDMFELLHVEKTTAFFRRTAASTFSPEGDGWWLQGYNKARFPIESAAEPADSIGRDPNLSLGSQPKPAFPPRRANPWCQKGRTDPFARVSSLSDQEWLSILVRSVEEPVIDGIRMPSFPDEVTQKTIVGAVGAHTLLEAFNFFLTVKKYCDRLDRPLDDQTRLLDFGCGWGRILRFFLKDCTPAHLWGIDVDPGLLTICRGAMPFSNFTTCDPLPPTVFADQSFDVITAYSVFSHLAEHASLSWVKEFARVLKPGGIMVVTTEPREFIELCRSLRGREHEFAWYTALAESFVDTEAAYRAYDAGQYLYAPTGGGPNRPADFYGEALIPESYVRARWTPFLRFVDFVNDPSHLPQALVVMQKG